MTGHASSPFCRLETVQCEFIAIHFDKQSDLAGILIAGISQQVKKKSGFRVFFWYTAGALFGTRSEKWFHAGSSKS